MKPLADSIDDALARFDNIAKEALARRGRLELHAAGQPQTIACERHPNQIRRIDLDESSRRTARKSETEGVETFVVAYSRCPECDLEKSVLNESHWLTSAGVPSLLLHGSFKTFRIERDEDRDNLATAKAFVEKRRGFLIMTGNVGDGKSLLAVAILREFLAGKFITQNDLLLDLRRGYRDPKAEDVIRRCQEARCLVIDDFGLSMGGKDELPMLQSILDHRHGERKPVIITSNLTLPGIYALIGPRLEDRFKQATYRVLNFTGPSSRTSERQSYFA